MNRLVPSLTLTLTLPARMLFGVLLFGVLLSGCGATSAPPAPVTITSEIFSPMSINARKLTIVENWQMPVTAPYAGHRQTPYPSNLVSDWASTVLVPAGGSGELILDISRAAVMQEKLVREDSLTKTLTDEQDVRIRVELEAQLMWLQPVGDAQARIKLSAVHSVTVAESATANDVQAAINDSLQAALAALDLQARAELSKVDNIALQ